jgi:hypothetical protein
MALRITLGACSRKADVPLPGDRGGFEEVEVADGVRGVLEFDGVPCIWSKAQSGGVGQNQIR